MTVKRRPFNVPFFLELFSRRFATRNEVLATSDSNEMSVRMKLLLSANDVLLLSFIGHRHDVVALFSKCR
jgi:hypothetical protein